MTISNEAVEAAARALAAHDCLGGPNWDFANEHWQGYAGSAEAALEAAAPHMLPAPEGVSEAEDYKQAFGAAHQLLEHAQTRADRAEFLLALALECARETGERAEKAEKERDEARKQAQDGRETLKAWFELAKKVEGQATETVISGLKGYLRTAKNGGMDTDVANAAQDVLEDYCRLYFGRDLVPVLRGMSTARAQAAEAKVKEAREIIDEVVGCFQAALAEGWIDALANGDVERIQDIEARRISYAHAAALRWTEEASQGEGE